MTLRVGGSRLSVIMTLTVGNMICESPLSHLLVLQSLGIVYKTVEIAEKNSKVESIRSLTILAVILKVQNQQSTSIVVDLEVGGTNRVIQSNFLYY